MSSLSLSGPAAVFRLSEYEVPLLLLLLRLSLSGPGRSFFSSPRVSVLSSGGPVQLASSCPPPSSVLCLSACGPGPVPSTLLPSWPKDTPGWAPGSPRDLTDEGDGGQACPQPPPPTIHQ